MDKKFKVLKIDHVAFATSSIDKTKTIFSKILGINSNEIEKVENENVKVLKFFTDRSKSKIELLEPLIENSIINKFLNKKGNSLHHIALEVDNLHNAIDYLIYNQIKLIYDVPQKGSDNKLITFIHPSMTSGLLIELCQGQ